MWRTLPMPGCSGLYGPGGVGPPPNQNRDTLRSGWGRAHSILLRRRKNRKCSELSKICPWWVCTLQQVPTSMTVQTLFISEIEFRFTFLGQKSQKVDLKAPFSISKNSIIVNDLLAGASEHKSEKFFLSSNFWNFLKFLIFFKKRIWFPLELQL